MNLNDGSVERVIEPVTSFLEALLGGQEKEKMKKIFFRFRNDMATTLNCKRFLFVGRTRTESGRELIINCNDNSALL